MGFFFMENFMAISKYTQDNENQKFVESSGTPGQPAVAVANVDGSAIGNTPGTPTVTTVSVATSSTPVLAANSSRKMVVFSNVGSNNIYLNLAGGTAVATNTLLVPNATLILDKYVTLTARTGIAATGASNLSVTEFV
jgi:hypothetical protein